MPSSQAKDVTTRRSFGLSSSSSATTVHHTVNEASSDTQPEPRQNLFKVAGLSDDTWRAFSEKASKEDEEFFKA
ncbi:hypothetical protein AcW1_006364 [Taiwanofungus camphoratus]|nr:hypothetical protein AcW1_006364 [Antrodia cinnamomea]